MASQRELDTCYMQTAKAHAALSKAERKKVGACLVTQHGVILGGCNGMAPNGSNVLEEKIYSQGAGAWLDEETFHEQYPFKDETGYYALKTKPETIHAELSCILKAAREGVSVVGATLYTTLSPCIVCSEMIAASGVRRVVYEENYRDCSGLSNLMGHRIMAEKFNEKCEPFN